MNREFARKSLATALICICILLAFAAVPLRRASGEQSVLRVGVPADRCPIFYRDPDTNEIRGIGADLMRAAAEKAGFTAVITTVRENTLKAALDSDEYDVILPFGSAVESASGHPSVVSDNLFRTPFTLVTVGGRAISSPEKLTVGMHQALAAGAETVHSLYPSMTIVLYESMDECVKALRSGALDALLHNSYVWSYVLQKPSYNDLKVQPSAMFSMDFRAGTRDTPEGRALIERLNGGIARIEETQRQAIILDYTSRRLYRNDFSDYLYQYGLYLLLTVLLVIAISVIAYQRIATVRAEHEKKLRRMIDTDPMTGAYSLNGFRKRVEELLHAHPDIPYLLTYNNIKDFKYINDSRGRETGDEVLRFWAQKLQSSLTEEEAMGRVAGDRFAILCRARDEEELIREDRELLEPVRNYFVRRGENNRLQVSRGVYVLTPEDYRHARVDHMLDCAHMAEKRVRQTRSDGYDFYNPEQWEKGKRTAEITSHLSEAVASGEIQVWYQPQVNYHRQKITGAEALCRWNHASLGLLSPTEFIPVLEQAGLIHELDRYVWETVCRDLRRWNAMGVRQSVSVNLSRFDIRDDRNIAEYFAGLVRTYEVEPEQLRIEITETAYVDNPGLLIRTTETLRELGFQVEMDDFGSGYSSLHMLKELPVDRVKLDLYFLTETGDQERGRIIVRSMIQMGKSLGMKLIAEGVENVEQARFLQESGCSEMQGFYFYRPMTQQDFEKLIAG